MCVHKHVHQQILSRQDLSRHGTLLSCEENSEGLVLWLMCPDEPVDRVLSGQDRGLGYRAGLGPCCGTGATLGPAGSAAGRPCWALDSPAPQV